MQQDSPGVRVPPPLYFVGAFAAGLGIHHLYPISFESGTAIRVVSILAGVAALALAGSAVGVMWAVRTGIFPHHPATALVRRGPFRFTRNPMYISLALIYTAIALRAGLVWPMLTLPLAVAGIQTIVIRAEEAYLIRRFGEDYREFIRQTPRWL